MSSELVIPKEFIVQTSTACNLRCKVCNRQEVYPDQPAGEISEQTWKKFISDLAQIQKNAPGPEPYKPIINFGLLYEPLMDKKLITRIMQLKTKVNAHCTIITNGFLLLEKLPKLKEVLDGLSISILGGINPPFSYEENTGQKFKEIVKIIKTTANAGVEVNVLLTLADTKDLSQILSYFSSQPKIRITLSKLYAPGAEDLGGFDLKSVEHLLKLSEKTHGNDIMLAWSLPLQKLGRLQQVCDIPWRLLALRANGDVMSCHISDQVIGNINEKFILEIFNNKTMQELRQNILKGKFGQAYCQKDCGYKFK